MRPRPPERAGPSPPRESGTLAGMSDAEEKSLDLVQRVVISAILCVVFGAPTVALAAYAPHRAQTSTGDAIGLWVMGLILGLAAAEAVLFTNRRKPWHPAVLIGLLPAAISAYWMWIR
jgi:hypothetical protein